MTHMPELPPSMVEAAAKFLFLCRYPSAKWELAPESEHEWCRFAAQRTLQAAHVPELLEALRDAETYLSSVVTKCPFKVCDKCEELEDCLRGRTLLQIRAALKAVGVTR